MNGPVLMQIVGAPVACEGGVKDTWRETAKWASDQLRLLFARAGPPSAFKPDPDNRRIRLASGGLGFSLR